MFATKTSKASHPSGSKTISRLFVLDASDGRILSVNPDGSDRKVIITGCRIPDGGTSRQPLGYAPRAL